MNKTKKMLVLLVVFLLLLGLYLVITMTGADTPDEGDDDDADVQESYPVIAVNADALVEFSYTLSGVEYRYLLSEDKTAWHWVGDETLPLDNSDITVMISAVMDVTSTYRYENIPTESLGDYGLEEGCMTASFIYEDGTKQVLRFGKTNTYNSMTYCCLESDLQTIYMVSPYLSSYFAVLPTDMVVDDALPTYTKEQFKGIWLKQGEASILCSYQYEEDEPDADAEKVLIAYHNGSGEGEVLSDDIRDTVIQTMMSLTLEDAVTFDSALWDEYGVGETSNYELAVHYTYTYGVENSETGLTTNTEIQTFYTLMVGNLVSEGGSAVWVRLDGANGVYAAELSEILALLEN